MFKKYGDDTPVESYMDIDGTEQVCPTCNKSLVTVAFDNEDNMELVCTCETQNTEQLDG